MNLITCSNFAYGIYMFSLYSIVSKFVSFISVSFVITLNASSIIQVNKKSKGVKGKNYRKQSSWVWVYDIQRQLVLLTIFVVMNKHTICYGKQQVKRATSLVIANGHFWSSPSVCGEVPVLLNTLVSNTPKGHQSRSVKIINNMIRITSPCYNKK